MINTKRINRVMEMESLIKKDNDKRYCTHYDKDGHIDETYWKLHPKLSPYEKKVKNNDKVVMATRNNNLMII